MADYELLAPLDAFFLYAESPTTPMHLGSVAVFEGEPLFDRDGALRIEALRREIAGRLHLVPKLRRRVRFPVGSATLPVWVDDPAFDVSFHVRHLALPSPGADAELTELCSDLMAAPLDRSRPLWEMWFVEGLHGGRVALVTKLHHAMADGMASVELATVLLDVERHPATRLSPRPWRARPAPAAPRVLAHDLARRAGAAVRVGTGAFTAAGDPLGAGHRGIEVADALGTLVTPRTIAPRSSLNVPVGPRRRFAVVRHPLEPLRLVQQRFGVTLNDVVLGAVTGGLGALLTGRGEPTAGRALQALVPVGSDHHGDGRLGNRVSALLVPLPVGLDDPVTRLRAVADAVGARKRHHQAFVGEALLGALDALPAGLLATLSPLVHRQRLCNLVVTNVPGPQVPLYALGARLLEAFPVVPLGGNLSVGIAVFSYDGQLTVGILADRERCGDVDVLGAGIERSLFDLVAAGQSSPRRRPAPESLGVAPARPRRAVATRHTAPTGPQRAGAVLHEALSGTGAPSADAGRQASPDGGSAS